MFGGHIWELAIVVVLALIVFGPKRLPEIGGAMGKGIREFKKGTQELQDSFHVDTSPTPARPVTPRPVDVPPVVDSSAPQPTVDREAS